MDRAPGEHTGSHDEPAELPVPEPVTPVDDGWDDDWEDDWDRPGEDAPILGGAGLMLAVTLMVLVVLLTMQVTGLS